MEKYIKGISFALILAASSAAQAVPALFFDGSISYTTTGGIAGNEKVLSVASDITGTQDLSVTLDSITIGSFDKFGTIDFSSIFQSVSSEVGFFSTTITGTFASNPNVEDIIAKDIYGNTLFSGNFDSIQLLGREGRDSGRVEGVINTTINSGSLANEFGIGTLVALQFSLTSDFSSTMFDSDFSGNIDGNITGETLTVSEPGIAGLLGLGVLITGFTHYRSRRSNAKTNR